MVLAMCLQSSRSPHTSDNCQTITRPSWSGRGFRPSPFPFYYLPRPYLPPHARYRLASTIFQTFVASDNSSETFASLKRIHGLMPYFLVKAALKISNPVSMIRNILDIFLAQPFGGRSLLQRYDSPLLPLPPSCKYHVACSPLPSPKKSKP